MEDNNIMTTSGRKGIRKVERHGIMTKDTKHGINNSAIRRLARRGGVTDISGCIYGVTRAALKIFLDAVIEDTLHYTFIARRRTVTVMDVLYALNQRGITLYGYNGWNTLSFVATRVFPPCVSNLKTGSFQSHQ